MADVAARSSLLNSSEIATGKLRKRSHKSKTNERWEPPANEDWDPTLPYGGKVYLARRKKPDPWWVIALEVRTFNCVVFLRSASGLFASRRRNALVLKGENITANPQTFSCKM